MVSSGAVQFEGVVEDPAPDVRTVAGNRGQQAECVAADGVAVDGATAFE